MRYKDPSTRWPNTREAQFAIPNPVTGRVGLFQARRDI